MKKTRIFMLIVLLLIALCCVLFIPFRKGVVSYKSVSSNLIITRFDNPSVLQNEFAIKDGKLYLKYQTTYHALALVTAVKHEKWDKTLLNKFRMNNSKLENYWPAPNEDN